MFKIKDGYKLEMQTPGTMKFLEKTKTGENVPSLEVVEVVLVQCKLVDNQHQQKSEVLYTFTPSKCYLLNAEPGKLVFLKIYNTEFDEIIITFTIQNDRPLEIEMTRFSNLAMKQCSIEPRTRKYVKGFLSFAKN